MIQQISQFIVETWKKLDVAIENAQKITLGKEFLIKGVELQAQLDLEYDDLLISIDCLRADS